MTIDVNSLVYYYWVKSKNALETSAFSLSDSGYRSGEIHIQPEVTINGESGEVALRRGDTLSVAIFLMAVSSSDANWDTRLRTTLREGPRNRPVVPGTRTAQVDFSEDSFTDFQQVLSPAPSVIYG